MADVDNHRVRRFDPVAQTVSTIIGTGAAGYNGESLPGNATDLYFPRGVAVDDNGNLAVADMGNNRVRWFNSGSQQVTTIVGDGTPDFNGDGAPGTETRLNAPMDVAGEKTRGGWRQFMRPSPQMWLPRLLISHFFPPRTRLQPLTTCTRAFTHPSVNPIACICPACHPLQLMVPATSSSRTATTTVCGCGRLGTVRCQPLLG